jgi:hypothetical protein
MKINAKTFAGIGVGLLAGYFLFKTKNKKFLYIGGMGLAGGILANLVFNRETSKKSVTLSTKNYVQEADDELFDEETGNLETEQVPTIMPNMEKVNPKQQSDIDLEYPQN